MGNFMSVVRAAFDPIPATGELLETGIISAISKEFCVVTFNLDGTPKNLSFRKSEFYFWGNQCEGDLTNILEEGTEVNLCYNISKSQDPTVRAVWIGDKPEFLNGPLLNIYYQEGYVVEILDDGTFVICGEDIPNIVIAKKDVIYRDGFPIDANTISIEDMVMFDAVPLEVEHPSGAMYQATCVWTGKEPRVADRFSLRAMDLVKQKTNSFEVNGVFGSVVVIPNDAVAFVEVENTNEKILLFRSSFNQSCGSIHDVVHVGDRLCLQLGFAYFFGSRKQWFAVKAYKIGEESNGILADQPVELTSSTLPSFVEPKSAVERSGECKSKLSSISSVKTFSRKTPPVTLSKTNILYGEPPLSGVIFSKEPVQDNAIIYHEGLYICVNVCDVYVNGRICRKDEFCSLVKRGEEIVHFEAVPYSMSTFKIKFTHYATCVWVGEKPPLTVVASSIWDIDDSRLSLNDCFYVGRVENFYFPHVALLLIESNRGNLLSVVCLHSCEFDCKTKTSAKTNRSVDKFISDFVEFQGYIQFKVRRNAKCSLGLCAYDVKKLGPTKTAAKKSSVQCAQLSHKPKSATSKEKGNSAAEVANKSHLGMSVKDAKKSSDVISRSNTKVDESSQKLKSACSEINGDTPTSTDNISLNLREYVKKPTDPKATSSVLSQKLESARPEMNGNYVESVASPFIVSFSLANRSFILNGVGAVDSDETHGVGIKHAFGFSKLETVSDYQENHGCEIRFDAQSFQSPKAFNILELRLQRTWKPETLKPASEGMFTSIFVPPIYAHLNANQLHCGVIVLILLHDSAIAEVNNVPVFITLDSIVTLPKPDPNFHSIEYFLSVGDHVVLKIQYEANPIHHFRATACYKLKGKPGGKIEVEGLNQTSWRSVWESGEYFRTGQVKESGGKYSVDFVLSKLPDTNASLDLSGVFKTGKLYVDGKLFVSESMSFLKNRDISFHVSCKPADKSGSVELRIEWAWLGNYPLLQTLLNSRIVAPGGVICIGWFYEGVVEDFPLPTYAICQVGFLSVLLPLTAKKKDGDIVGVVESHMKKGDRVVLSVKEQFCVKQTMLIASVCKATIKLFDESEVLLNIRGTVVTLPCPMGKIKINSLDVYFDRSSVVAVNGINKKTDLFEWTELIDASISVGTEVYFSAAKDLTWNKWYRAYEVRVEKLNELNVK